MVDGADRSALRRVLDYQVFDIKDGPDGAMASFAPAAAPDC
jgi:hypothetical protein